MFDICLREDASQDSFRPPLHTMDPGFQYCTPEELLLSAQPNPSLHCFNRNESIALAVCVFFSFHNAPSDAELESVLGAVRHIVVGGVSCDIRTDPGEPEYHSH
jgi:hypothetical protein